MTESSVTGTRPRFIFTNDEKAHLFTLVKLLMVQLDQPKGPLSDYHYYAENIQALLEGRAQALPRVEPDPVPYVQDDWSDLEQVSIKALNLSNTLTYLLLRAGIGSVSQLLTTPEAEIFGEKKPRNLGPKSADAIRQSLAAQGLQFITDPENILAKDAIRKSLTLSGLYSLDIYNIDIAEITELIGNLGIVTLSDLARVTLAGISAELIGNDYACVRRPIGVLGITSFTDVGLGEVSPSYVARSSQSVVTFIDDVLARYGQPPLQK